MTVTLGIDTGGTYTDAVLVEHDSGVVLSSAKALTTYDDLSRGIGQAVAAVLGENGTAAASVGLVALSTTLATNAIVEGRGSPVCLLLIGYDPQLIRQYGFEHELVTQDVVYLGGGHHGNGDEQQPLDEDAARQAILARRDRVEAFAVSGYFSVRNPAHEQRVRALVEELTAGDGREPLPVTCGHELTTRLNAVRRATTAALNARLIPLLRELIATVRGSLDVLGITAPLMVVRGDGSLVRAEWALRRPIETILSGPAASVIGAWHLAGQQDGWVVDLGGTTTDIAVLDGGRPRLNPEGAQVGQWRTMVEAVDVHTVGLGGDSLVTLTPGRTLAIGPNRVIPLCMLASQHPHIKKELRRREDTDPALATQFVLALRHTAPGLSEGEAQLLAALAGGPLSLRELADRLDYSSLAVRRVQALETRRVVMRAGFTPTDALHVLGHFRHWDAQASQLGANWLAASLGLDVETLCERVVTGVSDRVTAEVVAKALTDEGIPVDWTHDATAAALLTRALGTNSSSSLGCRFTLYRPLMAIGAPAEAYLPRSADQLHTDVVIPAYAGVANAVGAAVGGVVQQVRVIIRPLDDDNETVRLHLPDGIHDFASVEASVAYARRVVPEWLGAQAQLAGTSQVEIHVTRTDQTARVTLGWGEQIYLGTELTFTALGRPSPAR